LTGHELSV